MKHLLLSPHVISVPLADMMLVYTDIYRTLHSTTLHVQLHTIYDFKNNTPTMYCYILILCGFVSFIIIISIIIYNGGSS